MGLTSISKNIPTGRIGFRDCSIERQPDILPSRKVEGQSRKIQEKEATIKQLEKGMKTVIARLQEQDSKIEKVSAQFAVSKPAPQMVENR